MIINNKKEFDDFYPYPNYKDHEYPKEYPCVCKQEWCGGGLMGEYSKVYVAYFPKDITSDEAFVIGLEQNWETLK